MIDDILDGMFASMDELLTEVQRNGKTSDDRISLHIGVIAEHIAALAYGITMLRVFEVKKEENEEPKKPYVPPKAISGPISTAGETTVAEVYRLLVNEWKEKKKQAIYTKAVAASKNRWDVSILSKDRLNEFCDTIAYVTGIQLYNTEGITEAEEDATHENDGDN